MQAGGSYVFVVRGDADLDNLAPIIWTCSKDGQAVVVLTTTARASRKVKTSWWYTEAERITLVEGHDEDWSVATRIAKAWTRNRKAVKRELRRLDAVLLCCEWSEGIGSADRKVPLAERNWLLGNAVIQLQFAAHELGIATVALPHGHSTKTTLILNEHVRSMMSRHAGRLPFADRDSFAAYVFAAEYHRKVIIENSSMSAANTEVWGSARYNDVWVPQMYGHTSPAQLPALPHGPVRRVLFFVPKWQNLVDRAATLQLIAGLGADNRLQLVVRGHLRAEAAALAPEERAVLERGNVVLITDDVSSASLIKACDVVVDIDSSIAFDAVLLGKPYVRPRYLQDSSVKTIWDELGGAHQTASLNDTIQLLTSDTLLPAARHASFDDVVFGGSGTQVLARYRDGLRALAAQSRV